MKTAGIWSSMKAIYPMVGASAAACAQNLKSSSFTGSFSSGWTFASNGVQGNGTSSFYNTNLNESTTMTLNNMHISVYSRTNKDALMCDMGVAGGGRETDMFSRFSNGFYARVTDNGGASPISNSSSLGLFTANRTSSTQVKAIINSTISVISANSVSLNNFTYYLGAYNSSTGATFPTDRQYAFCTIGDGLTDTQASNFYTAVQAFQTTLARQVV
jgi:hypothetical protein